MMKIDAKINRAYNRLLSEIHKGLKVKADIKRYRNIMKTYDPLFPFEKGVPISMKHISQECMDAHMFFMRVYSCRRGFIPDSVSREEYEEIIGINIVASVKSNMKTKGKDRNVCWVVCSGCGCSSQRSLTDARLLEILSIQLGTKKEESGIGSFRCINCY